MLSPICMEKMDMGRGKVSFPRALPVTGRPKGFLTPNLHAPFPTATTLILFLVSVPQSRGWDPQGPQAYYAYVGFREGGFHRTHWKPRSKSPQKSKVASGTRCRHPAGAGEKVEGASGPQSREGHKPGDEQGDAAHSTRT